MSAKTPFNVGAEVISLDRTRIHIGANFNGLATIAEKQAATVSMSSEIVGHLDPDRVTVVLHGPVHSDMPTQFIIPRKILQELAEVALQMDANIAQRIPQLAIPVSREIEDVMRS